MNNAKMTVHFRNDENRDGLEQVKTVSEAVKQGHIEQGEDSFDVVTIIITRSDSFGMAESFIGIDDREDFVMEFLQEKYSEDLEQGTLLAYEQLTVDDYLNKYEEYSA